MLATVSRAVLRVLRFLFILMLIILPVPGAWVLVLLGTPRKNLPAELMRKKP